MAKCSLSEILAKRRRRRHRRRRCRRRRHRHQHRFLLYLAKYKVSIQLIRATTSFSIAAKFNNHSAAVLRWSALKRENRGSRVFFSVYFNSSPGEDLSLSISRKLERKGQSHCP